MAKLYSIYGQWLEHDGKIITLEGHKHKLRAYCVGEYIYVYAEPLDKSSKWYQDIKHQLGDDWSTDILDGSLEQLCDVIEQVTGNR